jgi:CDP-diacylglycerol--serine O-phosphatidyltransferase
MLKHIPNMLTIANLFLGIIAILLAFQNEQEYVNYAAIIVIIGMVFDGLDGRLARMLNAQSEFGKQLDSLSDVVTFGVAPAVIMYMAVLQDLQVLGIMVTAVFPICGALRLARFNAESPEGVGYFVGLPITAAGGALATLALYNNMLSGIYLMIIMLALSFLMVSNVKYPNFKKVGMPKSIFWVGPLVLGFVMLGMFYPTVFPKVVSGVLIFYACFGIKKSIDSSRRKSKAMKQEEEEQVYQDSI